MATTLPLPGTRRLRRDIARGGGLRRSQTSSRRGFRLRPLATLTAVMLLLNIAWRLVRYLMNQPLWGDEAMLAVNFFDRSFLELLNTLDYAQTAPPAFLWASLAVTRWLGFSESALRLLPMIAGMASILLFAGLARRVLPPREALLALAVLAASYYPLRHSVELKPYSTDLLISLLFIWQGVLLRRRPDSLWRWTVLALLCVLGVWCSYPAAFLGGGVLLALLPRLRAGVLPGQQLFQARAAWLLTGVLLCSSFAAMVVCCAEVHRAAEAVCRPMTMWEISFPPTDRPWLVPLWLLKTHASRMMGYPLGGKNFASIGTLLLVIGGAVVLWRGRPGGRALLGLLLAPLGLGLLAATLNTYPYGGTIRTMLYAAPTICLLTGVGLASLIRLCPTDWRPRATLAVVGLMALIAVGGIVNEVLHPYKSPSDAQTRRAIEELSHMAEAGDRWVIVNRSQITPAGARILYGDVAIGPFEFYLQSLALVPLEWSPAVENLPPTAGRLWLISYDSRRFPMPEGAESHYRTALTKQYGQPQQMQWQLDESQTVTALLFDARGR